MPRRGTSLRAALVLALLGAAIPAVPAAAGAEEAVLPARHQALLLLRVIAYDRALPGRGDRRVTVALAVSPGDAAGAARAEALAGAIREASLEFTVLGLPLRAVVMTAERGKLATRLREVGAGVMVLVGALATEPEEACQAAREAQVLSATSTRAAAQACVALGLVAEGARARILVNLREARAAGADLDSALLGTAQLVGFGR